MDGAVARNTLCQILLKYELSMMPHKVMKRVGINQHLRIER